MIQYFLYSIFCPQNPRYSSVYLHFKRLNFVLHFLIYYPSSTPQRSMKYAWYLLTLSVNCYAACFDTIIFFTMLNVHPSVHFFPSVNFCFIFPIIYYHVPQLYEKSQMFQFFNIYTDVYRWFCTLLLFTINICLSSVYFQSIFLT